MMPAPTLRPTTASDTTGQVNMLLPPASPDSPDAEAAAIQLDIDVSLAAMSVSPPPSAAAASVRNVGGPIDPGTGSARAAATSPITLWLRPRSPGSGRRGCRHDGRLGRVGTALDPDAI